MKQLLTLLFVACSFFLSDTYAQGSLSPKAVAKYGNVEVNYSRPSKRNRVIFGVLEPYGQVWRTGANEATEITFKKDGLFGGKKVKAGTYTLFTIPGEKDWVVILNSKLGQWGAFEYENVKDKDVVNVTVPSKKKAEVTEQFTITVKADELLLDWDQTLVAVPIKF